MNGIYYYVLHETSEAWAQIGEWKYTNSVVDELIGEIDRARFEQLLRQGYVDSTAKMVSA